VPWPGRLGLSARPRPEWLPSPWLLCLKRPLSLTSSSSSASTTTALHYLNQHQRGVMN